MPDQPAFDRMAAIIAAMTALVTGPPNLVGFDFADLRTGLIEGGYALFGQGEASGPDRTIRAADAAIADMHSVPAQPSRHAALPTGNSRSFARTNPFDG
jgi:cell division GTPase FtsZ